jgi:hypothetical protein
MVLLKHYGGKKIKAPARDLIRRHSGFYKFCFLRNTYDRVASVWHENFYNYSLDDPKMKIHHQGKVVCPVSFEYFIDLIEIRRAGRPYRDKYVVEVFDYRIKKWVMGPRVLCKVLNHAEPYYRHPQIRYCNFVGRTDNLQHGFDRVCKKVSAKPMKLPHLNPDAKNPDNRLYYTDDLRKRVYRLYKRDIDKYRFRL